MIIWGDSSTGGEKEPAYIRENGVIRRLCNTSCIMFSNQFMNVFIDESEWKRLLKLKTLYVFKFYVQVVETGSMMPCSI